MREVEIIIAPFFKFGIEVGVVLVALTFVGILSLIFAMLGRIYRQKTSQIIAQLMLGYVAAQIVSLALGILVPIKTVLLIGFSGLMVVAVLCLLAFRKQQPNSLDTSGDAAS